MKKLLVLLILIGSQIHSKAQAILDTDSIVLSMYNPVTREFEAYNANDYLFSKDFGSLTLGNFGQQTLLLSEVDFRLDPVRFGAATFLAEQPFLIKSNKTFSQIAFSNTLNEGALFRATVARPINENWLASIVFDRNNTVGQYQRETVSSNYANFAIARLNDTLDLQFLMSASIGTLKRQVNGGISTPDVFESNSVTNRELMAVNLQAAEQKLHLLDVKVSSPYIIYRAIDSSAKFNHTVTPSLSVKRTYFTYLDNDPLSGFYQSINIDSSKTLDSNAFENIAGQIDYKIDNKNGELEVGVKWQKENTYQGYTNRQEWIQGIIQATKNIGEGELALKSQFNIGKVKGHIVDLDFMHPINKKLKVRMRLNNTTSRNVPYLYKYVDNHNSWKSPWLNPQQSSWNIGLEKETTKFIRLKSVKYTNRLFYNVDADLQQMSKTESLWQITAKWDWDISKLNFATQVVYHPNIASEPLLGLPEVVLKSTLIYSDNVFKGALPFRLGAQFNGFSKYYAKSYNPSLNNFYLQEDFKTPFYPYLDVFLELQIKSAFLKIQYEHLSQGITSYNYYINSAYVRPDRSLLFSVQWNFVN